MPHLVTVKKGFAHVINSPLSRGRRASTPRSLFAAVITVCMLLQTSVLGIQKQGTRVSPNVPGLTSTIFINEIHYDNTGTDADEGVEIAGPAGTSLTGWSLVPYNGNGGASYTPGATLSGTIPSQQGGYGTIFFPIAGLQNGSPDGIALVNGTTLVQFLCYEGTFTATNGPASGQLCTDIGVAEAGTEALGLTLQLQGSGTTYGNFTWAGPIAHTRNLPNTNQTFNGGPPVDNPPTVQSTTPADNAVNVAENTNISVTFNEPVTATASSFTISCSTSGSHPFTLSGGTTTYTLDPTTNFTPGEVCTVTVVAAQVTDQDGTPNNMAADFVFDFTIINVAPTSIHTIQGSGTASPLAGQVVSTSGIVTLLRTGANTGAGAANSFFMQEPNADADPNTSEGILVFTSSVPTVAVGDSVTVVGTVVEFNGMTEISPVTNVSVNSTGNGLPTPVTLTTTILDPTALPTQPQLEKYEGMRLGATSLKTVVPNDNFYDVDTVLENVPRPFREPGIEISNTVPPDPTTGVPDCCIPRWDENPERLKIDTNGRAGAANVGYTSNVIFTGVVGPLDFAFGEYRLVIEATPNASANMSAVPVPVPASNEFTVAGYNIENFTAGNTTQKLKASRAIRDVMRFPDVIGHIEILDLATLQSLATQVNNDAVAAGQPNPNYVAYLIPAGGTQNVGFLVKSSRVTVNTVTQERAAETFVNPVNGQTETLHDRPPLVLNANVEPAGANLNVIVVVNHLRSFIDIELVTGEGIRVREKRKKQAESLAGLLQELQTNNPTTPVISVGDYNAFQFSSGYDDSISVIKGNPTPDDQIVVDQSPDLVNPNYVNLIDEVPAEQRYSFIFEGTPQVLDHVIVNSIARSRYTRIAIAHSNSDFPENPPSLYASNTTRPERSSDHDMPVAYFNLNGPGLQGQVLISELRFRGPVPSQSPAPVSGENNEFIELYNNTDSPITVASTDGSAGWSVATDSDSFAALNPNAPAAVTSLFIIPNGTVIPARGHYLAANSVGYDLNSYAAPDISYSQNVPDDAGVALFSTSVVANYNDNSRIDSAGVVTSNIVTGPATSNPLFYEGTGLPQFAFDNEYSYVRKLNSGLPADTDDNASDFMIVSTNPAAGGGGARLGAPGPENLASPIQLNGRIKSVLLDVMCGGTGTATASLIPGAPADGTPVSGCQNRARDLVAQPQNNSNSGTLFIRRRFINTTAQPVSQLRFRVVDITTTNGISVPAGTADLRLLSSGDVTITTTNSQMVSVKGLTLEQPPSQPNGGGFNSTVALVTITTGTPLAPGASVAVQFRLGVQQSGTFRFFVNVEAGLSVPAASPNKVTNRSNASRGDKL